MTLFTNQTLALSRADKIVEGINTISKACGDKGIEVIQMERDILTSPITIIVHDPTLYDEIVTVGQALSSVN